MTTLTFVPIVVYDWTRSEAATPAPRPLCRHCGDPRRRVNRPRGLCWPCFYAPAIRELYPSTSKFAYRGLGVGKPHRRPLPAAPTAAIPGSPEKLLVLEQRARAGVRLFHPADARYEGDGRTAAFLKALASQEPAA